MNRRLEKRNSSVKKELRSIGELRGIEEDGTFEGYLTVWDTVDDYNSTFQKGSFKKTIQERGTKVKILYDHTHLIGSSMELREDDHGVYGKGKLNLAVDKAKEAYEFMKDGTLDGLSFQFRSIKEGFKNGVRVLQEVQLFEYGPVTFPANDAALVTSVRSQNFDESLITEQLYNEKYTVQDALHTTLSDIWWAGDTDAGNVIGKLDKALADYHAAYLDFATRWVNQFWVNSESRESPFGNELSKALHGVLTSQNKSISGLAAETSYTTEELTELRNGKLIANRTQLASLSEDVNTAFKEQRNKAVESLCLELREILTDSEKTRIAALLGPVEQRQSISDEEAQEMIEFFKTK